MSNYPTIVPYLAVADAAAAIAFYESAFGAEEKMRVPGAERGIMHAEVLINGGLIMLTDSAPDLGFPAPRPDDQVPVGIMVRWDRPAEVDAIYARAIAAGGTSETEPRDEPWGARYVAVRDPFGQRWWLHAPLPGDVKSTS
jgi:PhnB protein